MSYFLETQRLALRALRTEDADIIFDYRNDERCNKFQRWSIKDYEGVLAMVRQDLDCTLFQPTDHRVAIVDRETGDLVGDIMLFFKERTISLGYTISYRYHRQGYALEILSALIPALHEQFPDHEIIALVDPENKASIGLLKKLDFEDLGYAAPISSQVFAKWPIPEE